MTIVKINNRKSTLAQVNVLKRQELKSMCLEFGVNSPIHLGTPLEVETMLTSRLEKLGVQVFEHFKPSEGKYDRSSTLNRITRYRGKR